MDESAAFLRSVAPAAAVARSRSRKKRFLMVATAALAVVGVSMGVSFLDSSGTASISISQSTSTLVYPLSYAGSGTTSLPTGSGTNGPLTTTAFSGKTTLTGTNCVTGSQGTGGATSGYTSCSGVANAINDSAIANPSWSPVAGSAGTVTTAGDLAVIDATSATNYVTVNVYVTNLSALAVDYGSFAFPINVYSTTCTSSGSASPNCAAWSEVLASPSYTYLTDTSGVLTFNLAAAKYYDIVMEGTNHTASAPSGSPTTGPVSVGGSFYTNQTGGTGGSLSPTFYFTAYQS